MTNLKGINPGDTIITSYDDYEEIADLVIAVTDNGDDTLELTVKGISMKGAPVIWEKCPTDETSLIGTIFITEGMKMEVQANDEITRDITVNVTPNGFTRWGYGELLAVRVDNECVTWTPNIKADMFYTPHSRPAYLNANTKHFHATFNADWERDHAAYKNEDGEPLMVHMGTLEAALERIDALSVRADSDTFYIHEVYMDEDINLADELIADVFDGWFDGWNEDIHCGMDAFYYRNACESKDSMSLYVRADRIQVVRTYEFKMTDIDWDRMNSRFGPLGNSMKALNVFTHRPMVLAS